MSSEPQTEIDQPKEIEQKKESSPLPKPKEEKGTLAK